MTTEQEATLYKELVTFPHALVEMLSIKDDAYNLMYATPVLSHQYTSTGTRRCGSTVERIVVNVLASSYLRELEAFVTACRRLYDEATQEERNTLLLLWRGEVLPSAFPAGLLYRYATYKEIA